LRPIELRLAASTFFLLGVQRGLGTRDLRLTTSRLRLHGCKIGLRPVRLHRTTNVFHVFHSPTGLGAIHLRLAQEVAVIMPNTDAQNEDDDDIKRGKHPWHPPLLSRGFRLRCRGLPVKRSRQGLFPRQSVSPSIDRQPRQRQRGVWRFRIERIATLAPGFTSAGSSLSSLRETCHREPITRRELAAAPKVTPRNVRTLVNALEHTGFVKRTDHPSDRRATIVALTLKGSEAMSRMKIGKARLCRGTVRRPGSIDVDCRCG
jgi:hypothetical protein